DRPIVFAAGAGYEASFVLDGHHKLQAYRELGVPPAVLFICKEDDPIPIDEGSELLGAAQRYREDYRRVKRECGGIVTEADWLGSTSRWPLIGYVRNRSSARKQRLLLCACCRQEWGQIGEPGRQAVEVAERFADGLASEEELAAACRDAAAACEDLGQS